MEQLGCLKVRRDTGEIVEILAKTRADNVCMCDGSGKKLDQVLTDINRALAESGKKQIVSVEVIDGVTNLVITEANGSQTKTPIVAEGGASSWNDLEDKPFYEEGGVVHHLDPKYIKDMYFEEGGVKEVFPLTKADSEEDFTESSTLVYMPSDNMFLFTTSVVFNLVDGKKYTVSINGEEYETTATSVMKDGVSLMCLGDTSSLDGSDPTGEPFVIMVYPPFLVEDLGMAAAGILLVEPSTELTVGIFSVSDIHHIPPKYIRDMYHTDSDGIVHKIPHKYMPEKIIITQTSDGYTSNFAPAEILAMLDEDPTRDVFLTADLLGSKMCYRAHYIMHNGRNVNIEFTQQYVTDSGMVYRSVSVSADGIL